MSNSNGPSIDRDLSVDSLILWAKLDIIGCQAPDGSWTALEITSNLQTPEINLFGENVYGIVPLLRPHTQGPPPNSRYFPAQSWTAPVFSPKSLSYLYLKPLVRVCACAHACVCICFCVERESPIQVFLTFHNLYSKFATSPYSFNSLYNSGSFLT